jgi:CHAD domain-containing protein/CYTH domain-containing protein
MNVGNDVVDRSAEEGMRLIALTLLGAADEAAERLASAADEEALHDFRVALRRLRTVLRAFRPWTGEDIGRRLERKLKRCARATNAARDVEVQLAWLDSRKEALSERRQPGADAIRELLQARGSEAPPVRRVLERYTQASAKLARRLGTYERRIDTAGEGGGPGFGGVLAALATEQLEALSRRIDAIQGALDHEAIHRTRIEAKRLRYLLEPLRGNRHADSRDAVQHLRRLQDVLGELHDTHVLAEQVLQAMVDVARERAWRIHRAVYERGASAASARGSQRGGPAPGLVALDRMLRERRDALFADLDREWRVGGLELVAGEVNAIVATLEARAGGKLERERRYLLTALPPRAAEIQSAEIVQGWLPGSRLRERIRRVTDSTGDRYWRELRQGAGRVRLDADEETSREVFETLWPLTADRRIVKRRRKIREAGLEWNVDEYVERGFVLAEIRLPAGRTDVSLPDWLRPLVAREVTDDPAYQNEALIASARADLPEDRAAEAAPSDGGGAPPATDHAPTP